MKNILLKRWAFILSIVSMVIVLSCSEVEKLPVNFDELKVSGGAFASEISTDGSTDINKVDPASSSFTKTYQLTSPEGGSDVSKIELYVSFSGLTTSADETLYTSVNSDAFDSDGNVSIAVEGDVLLSSLGLTANDLEGGDTFNYRLALTTPNGVFTDVSSNFDNQSADHTYSSTVVCELAIIPEGEWRVDMEDSYGDGWQTDDASGGSGITVTLSTGEVLEIGLCSPYAPSNYDCTENDGFSGSGVINMPADITSAEWYFPGDVYGEIAFKIYSPSGNLVASSGTGESAAGVIPLNLCNE